MISFAPIRIYERQPPQLFASMGQTLFALAYVILPVGNGVKNSNATSPPAVSWQVSPPRSLSRASRTEQYRGAGYGNYYDNQRSAHELLSSDTLKGILPRR